MKRLRTLIAALALVGGALPAAAAPATPYALVYNGPVADADSTAAIADVAKQVGLAVKYVSRLDDLPMLLKSARVFIIGGTEDDVQPLVDAFTPALRRSLERYLRNGGRYLGICGGAYVASTGWPESTGFVKALGLIPASSDDYDGDFDPKIYPFTWLGEKRLMYYQAGPTFALNRGHTRVQTIATFENGKPAALMSAYGKGKVAVSGPHPEAPASWKSNAANGHTMQPNIHLAVGMLRELLSEHPVVVTPGN